MPDDQARQIARTADELRRVGRSTSDSDANRPHLVKILGVRALCAVGGSRDERAAAIASRQRGSVARWQLIQAGLTRGVIDGMTRRGQLICRHRGVYALGHAAEVELGAETAALLAFPHGAWLAGASAAALWGIRSPQPPGAAIEVVVRGDSAAHRRGGITVHRTGRLHRDDVRIHNRLPVTSPARTLVDLAGRLTARELERALDEALSGRAITSRTKVGEALARLPGRPTTPLARLLDVRRRSTRTKSDIEERFLALVRSAGLPEPRTLFKLGPWEIDFYWPSERVAVEIDSYGFHSTRSAFARDRYKDTALRELSIDVLRFIDDQLDDEPYRVIAAVVGALARRRR